MRRGCGGSSARRPAGPKFALLFSSGIDILHFGRITNTEQPLTIDPAQNTYPYEGEQPPKKRRRGSKAAAGESPAQPAAAGAAGSAAAAGSGESAGAASLTGEFSGAAGTTGESADAGSPPAAAPSPASGGTPPPPDDGAGQGPEPPAQDPEKRMPFLDHLEELRWRLIWSILAVIAAAVGCYIFIDEIVVLLVHPAPADIKLIFLSPTEAFMTYIKVAAYAGLVVALPFVALQFWRFVMPGLYEKERRAVGPIVIFTVLCFLVGALFAYFLIIPFGLKFLLSYQTDFLVANITIGKYLGFVVTLLLVFGLVFELPVLAYFLSLIGVLTPDFLRKKRRYGILILFVIAAILTPPDAFSQMMLAIPLLILYEISIWVSAAVHRKRKSREAEREKQWAG